MENRKRIVLIALMLLAVMGFIDSAVVYEKVFGGFYAPCIVGNGCDTILYSLYSKFLGISLSLWGMGFYGLLTLAVAWALIFKKDLLIKFSLGLIGAGFLFSLYLLYLQVFKIGTLCTYCLISFSDILASVILAFVLLRDKK
jgi:uncharacterized membrane protein